jgi:radical SAM protein with 4Fe4S-binding SPASM domain
MSVPFRRKPSAASVVARLRSDEHAPYSAMIEIADRCNEVCVHCYQVQGQKGEIGTDDWKRVLDELADMGVLFLTISGGEATLRHDFLDIVAHARAKRFAVKLYTNGLTMTPELAERLRELAVQEVQISLYSHRAEVHDWVTRVPGSWQKTVAGARALLAAGLKVVLKTPLMSVNAKEYREYVDFVSALGADYSVDPLLDPREDGDREPERLRPDDADYLAMMRDPIFANRRDAAPTKQLDRSVCGACSGNVHVEANGEMRPCTQLDVPVGNVMRQSIREAWETNEHAKVIRGLTWRDLPGCRECDLQPYCGRCFANARVEVGDAMAPYASACSRARLTWELRHGRPPEVRRTDASDGSVGPYLEVEPGVLTVASPPITPQPSAPSPSWARARPAAPPPDGTVRPGELVQIRRPGARAVHVERVPGAGELGAGELGAGELGAGELGAGEVVPPSSDAALTAVAPKPPRAEV